MNVFRKRSLAALLATALSLLVSASPVFAQCAGTICTVQTNADTTGGVQTSLRDAITHANANAGTTIGFSNTLPGQTITLASELPLILGNGTTVNGTTTNGNVTVSGANTYRAFFVGNTTATVSATIENLTIQNARASGGGGGMWASASSGAGSGGGAFGMSATGGTNGGAGAAGSFTGGASAGDSSGPFGAGGVGGSNGGGGSGNGGASGSSNGGGGGVGGAGGTTGGGGAATTCRRRRGSWRPAGSNGGGSGKFAFPDPPPSCR